MGKTLGCLGVLVVAVVVVAGIITLTRGKGDRDGRYRARAEGVRARPAPPAAKATGASPTTWTERSAESSWALETGQTWPAYAEFAATQLAPEFGLRHRSDGRIAFS